ncbi:eclosion hormone [Nesidiocoris tenuis]|uniref:Eclosion hormone n=1 Tax=Nesidiocoris tenuis TaxID=355587 RepID=A0ABN7AM02_9HEMI|nr:eclosion hormone [Nesidiocoris tenuis]
MRWIFIFATAILCGVAAKHDLSSICIMNCGQCKRMLGQFFRGPACAITCLKTNGLVSPDCNDPLTVKVYLKKLY